MSHYPLPSSSSKAPLFPSVFDKTPGGLTRQWPQAEPYSAPTKSYTSPHEPVSYPLGSLRQVGKSLTTTASKISVGQGQEMLTSHITPAMTPSSAAYPAYPSWSPDVGYPANVSYAPQAVPYYAYPQTMPMWSPGAGFASSGVAPLKLPTTAVMQPCPPGTETTDSSYKTLAEQGIRVIGSSDSKRRRSRSKSPTSLHRRERSISREKRYRDYIDRYQERVTVKERGRRSGSRDRVYYPLDETRRIDRPLIVSQGRTSRYSRSPSPRRLRSPSPKYPRHTARRRPSRSRSRGRRRRSRSIERRLSRHTPPRDKAPGDSRRTKSQEDKKGRVRTDPEKHKSIKKTKNKSNLIVVPLTHDDDNINKEVTEEENEDVELEVVDDEADNNESEVEAAEESENDDVKVVDECEEKDDDDDSDDEGKECLLVDECANQNSGQEEEEEEGDEDSWEAVEQDDNKSQDEEKQISGDDCDGTKIVSKAKPKDKKMSSGGSKLESVETELKGKSVTQRRGRNRERSSSGRRRHKSRESFRSRDRSLSRRRQSSRESNLSRRRGRSRERSLSRRSRDRSLSRRRQSSKESNLSRRRGRSRERSLSRRRRNRERRHRSRQRFGSKEGSPDRPYRSRDRSPNRLRQSKSIERSNRRPSKSSLHLGSKSISPDDRSSAEAHFDSASEDEKSEVVSWLRCCPAELYFTKDESVSNFVKGTEKLKELHNKFNNELVERAARVKVNQTPYQPPPRKITLYTPKASKDGSSSSEYSDESEDDEDHAMEELEIKKKHPYRLHPELWFNDPGEMNDGPLCRCSAKAQRSGIRHGIYPGEEPLPLCNPDTNNADRLYHYRISISPHTNFLMKNPTVIKHDQHDYIFEGFSMFSHFPLQNLPTCRVIRFNIEYAIFYKEEKFPENFTIEGLELITKYLFNEILEMVDLNWKAHGDSEGCPRFHFMPRFARSLEDNGKELLSLNVLLKYLINSSKPLYPAEDLFRITRTSESRWQKYADEVKGMIVTKPGMKPCSLRVDQIDREICFKNRDLFPEIIHFGIRPPQLSYAGNPVYQKAWREYVKFRHLLANKPKVLDEDRQKLLQKEAALQEMRMKSNLKRDVTVVIGSDGFFRTGIMCDIVQHALLLPVLVCHLRFHQSLDLLEKEIEMKFKDRYLLQLAVTHPSYRENFGTNPDHARNSLTNCGIRQPEYGDRRIHYLNTRKRGINTLINIMSRFGRKEETTSSINHNERLEFLGDAVVEFLTSIHLFFLFPDLEEGGLATYRAAVVQNQHLAVLARKLQLEKYMLYAHGSDLCHDLELRHAMANCFEALMGALFLDNGIGVADQVFSRTLFTEKDLLDVWVKYPPHPLQEQEPDGDRKWIETVPLLQRLHEFEELTGIEFSHIRLLARAFTHRCVGYNNLTLGSNQRLEFLGDTVLQLVASEYLYKFFPEHHEGHLSLLRSSLVNNRTQAVVCDDLGMTEYVIYPYPKGESKTKDRADLLEAFLGALYVDKGLEYCRNFCQVCFFPRLQDFILNQDWNDPKSKLQQCCLTLRSMDGGEPDIPVYKVTECKGPTNTRVYTVAVYFRRKRLATGSGHSIQQAQMAAASIALENSKALFPQLSHQKRVIERSLKQQQVPEGKDDSAKDTKESSKAKTNVDAPGKGNNQTKTKQSTKEKATSTKAIDHSDVTKKDKNQIKSKENTKKEAKVATSGSKSEVSLKADQKKSPKKEKSEPTSDSDSRQGSKGMQHRHHHHHHHHKTTDKPKDKATSPVKTQSAKKAPASEIVKKVPSKNVPVASTKKTSTVPEKSPVKTSIPKKTQAQTKTLKSSDTSKSKSSDLNTFEELQETKTKTLKSSDTSKSKSSDLNTFEELQETQTNTLKSSGTSKSKSSDLNTFEELQETMDLGNNSEEPENGAEVTASGEGNALTEKQSSEGRSDDGDVVEQEIWFDSGESDAEAAEEINESEPKEDSSEQKETQNQEELESGDPSKEEMMSMFKSILNDKKKSSGDQDDETFNNALNCLAKFLESKKKSSD